MDNADTGGIGQHVIDMLPIARIVGRSLGEMASCYSDPIKRDNEEHEECAPIIAKPGSGRWLMFWSTS